MSTVDRRSPHPLQWPEGWARTPYGQRHGRGTQRWQARFEARFAIDRDAVIRQLKRRGSQIVITSNLPVRGDGLPYASSPKQLDDPGVAVYWVEKGRERVIACDRWRTVDLNLRAIDLSLEALRGLDRWGATEMVERAFAGFAALPGAGETTFGEGIADPREIEPPRDWIGTFGLDVSAELWRDKEIVEKIYKRLALGVHPDHNGDGDARMVALNAAWAAAEAWFNWNVEYGDGL